MLKYIIAAAALIFPTSAQAAPDWRQVANDNDGSVFYLDANDMAAILDKPRTSRRFWVYVDATADATVSHYTAKQYIGINCETQRYRFHANVLFDENGRVTYSSYETGPYQYVVPGTVIAEIASYICAR